MYDGFISYSHAADDRLAPALQQGLQRLAKRWNHRRALRIFRDETGLTTSPHLWAAIEAALDESEWFVLLASPDAASSPWVNKEIAHWLATKSIDRMLPVVTDGTWEWNVAARDFTPGSSAVPDALRGALVAEPRHLDVRWARSETDLDLRNSRFRSAVADLAAPMHGVAKDELEGDDIRQHRRTVRVVRSAAAVLAVLLLVAVVASTVAIAQRNRAGRERDRARAAARTASLRALVDSSATQQSTKRDLAALLAVAAYRLDPSTASEGALLRTFTASQGYQRSIPLPDGKPAQFTEVLPAGRTALAIDDTTAIHFVDLITGREKGGLPAATPVPQTPAEAFSDDGRYLALLTYTGDDMATRLTVWDVRTRRRRFADQSPATYASAAFSSDDTLIALSGGFDANAEVRSAIDGHLLTTITGLPIPPGAQYHFNTSAVRFLADGTLAVSAQSGVVRIVDPRTGRELRRFTGPDQTAEVALALSADATVLFGSGATGSEAWDVASGRPLWKRSPEGVCNRLTFSEVIDAALCGRDDGRVLAYDRLTGTISARFDYQLGFVASASIGDHGRLLVEAGGNGLAVWRLDGTGPIVHEFRGDTGYNPIGFDARGDIIATRLLGSSPPTQARIIDPTTGAVLDPLPGIDYATTTPDPDRLIAQFSDGTTGLYDLTQHARVPKIRTRVAFVPTLAGSAGNILFLGDNEHLQQVDMTTGGLVGRTLHFDHGLGAASGDPSARRFITAEGDGVHVRSFSHPTSGRLIPDSKFGAGAISDRTVVIARADGKLRVLDAATLKQDGADLPSTVGLVFQMALTRDGKRLLVVGTDGTARIADMATRQVIGDAITLGPTVPGPVVIRPDGRALAFGDARGGITVWNLDPRAMVRAACQVASRNLTEAEWGEYAKALGPYQRVCPDQPATRGGR